MKYETKIGQVRNSKHKNGKESFAIYKKLWNKPEMGFSISPRRSVIYKTEWKR